jgi:signal transduction histidine kinase
MTLASPRTDRGVFDDGPARARLWRAAVERNPDGIAVSAGDPTDPAQLRIVYVNPAFEELASATSTSLVGRSPCVVVDSLLDAPAQAALADAVSRRVPLAVACTGCGSRVLELRAVPMTPADDPSAEWLWILRDITGRIRSEQRQRASMQDVLRERNKSLAEVQEELGIMQRLAPLATLAAGLGHDMSNLLLPMRAHLEGLAKSVRDPGAAEHIDALHGVLDYLRELTDGLRLMALDPDRPLVSDETTDLRAWWRTSEPLLAAMIRSPVRLAVDLPERLPSLRIAPHLLTLAVLNLIVNANDAIHEKGVIRLWARSTHDGTGVRIGVTDDGCGMAPEVRERAFDPFFSTKSRRHGTGLGLALVHGVVRAARGVVQVESRERVGTSIILTLPAVPAREACPPESTAPTSFVRVEDERVASCVHAMLHAFGFVPGTDPATCSVFVTDPSPAALAEARLLKGRSADAQLLVYGEAGSEWRSLGARVIGRGSGPSEIRRALSRLLLAAVEGGSRAT